MTVIKNLDALNAVVIEVLDTIPPPPGADILNR
jgi:hypothetical protein